MSSPTPACAEEPTPPAATVDYARRLIQCEIVVAGTPEQVWELWTTEAGITSFFAPRAHLEAKPLGKFEILFLSDEQSPVGLQGSEGCFFLALDAPKFLSFTWNAPPPWPTARAQRSWAEVRLLPVDAGHTKVQLRHGGFGEGGEWDLCFDYFSRAWSRTVLPALKYRLAVGPIDWANYPDLAAYRE